MVKLAPSDSNSTTSPSLSAIENTAIVARLAGFTGKALVTIVAIAGCESGYNPQILNNNPSTGDYSVGLFQINYFGSLLGPRTAAYGSPSQLQNDPQAQARAAYSISNGGANFTPWTTYISGCYLKNLPAASAAVASTGGIGAPSSAWSSTNATLTSSSSSSPSNPSDNPCLIKAPSVDLGLFSLGGNCLFRASQGRAVLGALCLAGGGLIALAAVGMMAKGTSVGKTAMSFAGPVGSVVSKIPDRNDRMAMRAKKNPNKRRDSYTSYPGPNERRRGNTAGKYPDEEAF